MTVEMVLLLRPRCAPRSLSGFGGGSAGAALAPAAALGARRLPAPAPSFDHQRLPPTESGGLEPGLELRPQVQRERARPVDPEGQRQRPAKRGEELGELRLGHDFLGAVVELKGLVRRLLAASFAQGLVSAPALLVAPFLVLDPGVGTVALAEVVVGALALWMFFWFRRDEREGDREGKRKVVLAAVAFASGGCMLNSRLSRQLVRLSFSSALKLRMEATRVQTLLSKKKQ